MESRKIEFAIGLYGPHVVKFINNILKNEITELNRNLVESSSNSRNIPFGGVNTHFGAVSNAPFGGTFGASQSVQPVGRLWSV